MGYTHYWDRDKKISRAVFRNIVRDFKKVLPFVQGRVKMRYAVINDSVVMFEGSENQSCETFYFARQDGSSLLEYVKTNRLPYDQVIMAFLSIVKVHVNGNFHVTTDGEDETWKDAFSLCSNILGHDYDLLEITELNNKLRYKVWDKVVTDG